MSDQGRRVAVVTGGARLLAAPGALASGFQRSLLTWRIFLLAAALIALRATNTRGEAVDPGVTALPDVQPLQRARRALARLGPLAPVDHDAEGT